jgi:tRNA(Ile)-lysidine synthase
MARNFLSQVRRTWIKHFPPPKQPVLAAVSGGADSMALLHVLAGLSREWGFRVEVAHMDHGLRGEESAEDARFVARMAEGMGLVCHLGRLIPGSLRRKGVSLQEAARAERLSWLERVASEAGAGQIALGHTANDAAEDVLMRLLTGAGTRGLAGMRPSRGRFIRPLIECSRQDIEAWLGEQGIAWREDSSNASPRYLRNRIRGQLIPELGRYNPSLREALVRQAAVLGDEDDLLDALAAERLAALRMPGEDTVLPCALLSAEHPALERRVLRLSLEGLAGGLRGISFRHIEALRGLARSVSPSARLALPGGLVAARRYGDLHLSRGARPSEQGFERRIAGPGSYDIPEAGRKLTLRLIEARAEAGENETLFDAGSLAWPLLLRSPRRGDRFHPRGMGGGRKLVFRLLADLKVPRFERGTFPLLASGETIIWVGGLRAAEEASPAAGGPYLAARLEAAPPHGHNCGPLG